MSVAALKVGTAGWSIPRAQAAAVPADGSALERYAGCFDAVEINSAFYRAHRPATYARWAASVPPGFRFAVKVPKAATHDRRLVDCDDILARFLEEAGPLGEALGPLLVQLPPSLAFEPDVAEAFFAAMRARHPGAVVCEPRHRGWFTDEADAFLRDRQIARVAADPAPQPRAGEPGGWPGLVYRRLHGAPRIYYSAYSPDMIAAVAARMADEAARGIPTWCILDNTALGHAFGDALALRSCAEVPSAR